MARRSGGADRAAAALAMLAALLLTAPAAAAGGTTSDPSPAAAGRVERLRAFARLYGDVRYFHPSDEASAIDWSRFAVLGSARAMAAEDPAALAGTLRELFAPIAPTVQVLAPGEVEAPPWSPADTEGLATIAWQHLGDGLTPRHAGVYRSVRLHRPRTLPARPRDGEPPRTVEVVPPLFPEHPEIGEAVRAEIGAGLVAVVPLALWGDAERTYPRPTAPLAPLAAALDALDPQTWTADDPAVRVAGVVIAWNVLQHFYAYFDVVPVDWDAVLTDSLARALAGPDAAAHRENLQLLTAALGDGHAGVDDGNRTGYLPVRLGLVEGRLAVLVSFEPRIAAGDLLLAIDGDDAAARLADLDRRLSGSPQWRRYRALDIGRLGGGAPGTRAVLRLARGDGGEVYEVEVERGEIPPPPRRPWPPLHRDADGVWTVDLNRARNEEVAAALLELAAAPGVVFDLRHYPRGGASIVLRHLLAAPDTSSRWMRIPKIVYPDRERIAGWDESGWELEPATPRIGGEVVFLIGPGAISYGESILGLVEHYGLATLVGETTAGTNGNVNFIDLPGRFAIVWTGMKVVRHDGSRHHLVGIRPTVPAARTLAGVRAERDEPLETALATVRAAIAARQTHDEIPGRER